MGMDEVFVSGINHKNADVSLRSSFSLNEEKISLAYRKAKEKGFRDFVILNTCNRTEIYGRGPVEEAENIILEVSGQTLSSFDEVKMVHKGGHALRHIFHVASGLESQILGDYEILGQFKKACKTSKKGELLSPLFERLANTCIQASKEIKTRTELSKGTVSTSYAAIEVIRKHFRHGSNPSILIVGTGKIGLNIARNIRHYLPDSPLTLSNRTLARAKETADAVGASVIDFEEVPALFRNYEVLIVATAYPGIIGESDVNADIRTSLVLDLAIPQAIDKNALPGTEVLNIDDISSILNNSIEQRKVYLPIAHEIINQHLDAFSEWHKLYRNRDRIIELKTMLKQASLHCPHLQEMDPELKEKKLNDAMHKFVQKLKENPDSRVDLQSIIENFKSVRHS